MISYWIFFGAMHIGIMCFQDVFKKRLIDDRHNWFMMGVTASLYFYFNKPLWWFGFLIVLMFGLSYFLSKAKIIAEGDINFIRWAFIGFAIISTKALVLFSTFIILSFLLNSIGLKIMCKILKKEYDGFPAYPSFFLSFLIAGLLNVQ